MTSDTERLAIMTRILKDMSALEVACKGDEWTADGARLRASGAFLEFCYAYKRDRENMLLAGSIATDHIEPSWYAKANRILMEQDRISGVWRRYRGKSLLASLKAWATGRQEE